MYIDVPCLSVIWVLGHHRDPNINNRNYLVGSQTTNYIGKFLNISNQGKVSTDTHTLLYVEFAQKKRYNLVEFGCKSQLVSLTAGYKWVFHVSINMPWTKLAAATKQALIIWYGDVKELHLKHVSKTWKMMNRHFHFILISIYSCNIWEILKKSTKPACS